MFGHKKQKSSESSLKLQQLSSEEKNKLDAAQAELASHKNRESELKKNIELLQGQLRQTRDSIAGIEGEINKKRFEDENVKDLEKLFNDKTSMSNVRCTYDRYHHQIHISVPEPLKNEAAITVEGVLGNFSILKSETVKQGFGNSRLVLYVDGQAKQSMMEGLKLLDSNPKKTDFPNFKC